MAEWKQQLSGIIEKYEERRRTEAERLALQKDALESFVENVVFPAFKSLSGELEKYGKKTEISISSNRSTLCILQQGDEDEFTYGIDIRHGHVTPFTERVDANTGKTYAGESYISGNVTKDSIMNLTSDDIIRDFLEEYARYLR